MNKRAELEAMVEDETLDPETLFADGFDEAIVGIVERFDGKEGHVNVVGYDYDRCIAILVERDGMDEDEALEYFEFNVIGAYMGPHTPAFIHVLQD